MDMTTSFVIDFDKHPLNIVLDIIKQLPKSSSCVFEFSHYSYNPDSIPDPRETFQVISRDINREYLESLVLNTPDNRNLALNSRVLFRDQPPMHIPMVDFVTKETALLYTFLESIPEDVARQMRFFDSGRSFHGYSTKLITEAEWIRLKGLLLLANKVDKEPVVDTRWIGHRLLGGYCSLRWTNNTGYYLSMPVELGL